MIYCAFSDLQNSEINNMTSEYLYVKIVDYLTNLKTDHIMSASVIYQGLEENPWISKVYMEEISFDMGRLVKL